MEDTILLKLEHISKTFDDKMILKDLNLEIRKNEFITLLGPSGCGKTTTLRIIGGFEMPDQGKVIFDGKDITKLNPEKRHINTVFQKYSLFSHIDNTPYHRHHSLHKAMRNQQTPYLDMSNQEVLFHRPLLL